MDTTETRATVSALRCRAEALATALYAARGRGTRELALVADDLADDLGLLALDLECVDRETAAA